MGVGGAFNTALGGLSAYGNQVGYISDNLANVSTPGFKRVDADFQSYVTLSTPTLHSPGGVNIAPAYRVSLPGQVSSSSNPTAFAIAEGDGFAPVAVPTSTTGGVANFSNSLPHYTRACDFSVDTSGYLVNSAGQYLEGVKEQTTYAGDIPGTPSLGSLVGVRVDPTVYKSIPGTASSLIDYNVNFPAGMAAVPINDPNATASQVTSQVQFFDSLGNSRTLQLTFQKVPVYNGQTLNGVTYPSTAPLMATGALADTTSQWQLVDAVIPGVPANGANSFDLMASLASMATTLAVPATAGALPAHSYASCTDSKGDLVGLTQAQHDSLLMFTGGAVPAVAVPLATDNTPSLYFTSVGAVNGVTSAANTNGAQAGIGIGPLLGLPIDWSAVTNPTIGATSPQALTLNFGAIATATSPATGSTQYAGSNLEVRSVTDTTGEAPGSFQKASIDNNGYVVFSYSNGAQKTPYRIPLVSFSDANKLDRITGAVFAGNDTLAGKPVARWSGEGDSGKIVPSSTEASNVDIADELTKMIVAQRAYSSNGKVITTADEMIQEALGLKR